MTSKPARASGSMFRHQMRFVSGYPWMSRSGRAADAFTDVREGHAVADLGVVRWELIRVGRHVA